MPSLSSSDPYGKLKISHPDLFQPIPARIGQTAQNSKGYVNGTVAGWRELDSPDFISIQENNEPLMSVSALSPMIRTEASPQYVRQTVGERLVQAQSLLPPGYELVVFEAWRSLERQYAMYEMCYSSLVKKLTDKAMLENTQLTPGADELVHQEVQKFVSLPSPLPDAVEQSADERDAARLIPSPHSTGGSVDVGIVKVGADGKARLLDFGTKYDFVGQSAALTYAETHDSLGLIARDSRRMLYAVMVGVGFEPYVEEWWHFNLGNQMAAMTKYRRTGQKEEACYGAVSAARDWQESTASVFDLRYRGDLAPEFVAAVKQAQMLQNS